jgi:hypothetical protein
MAAKAQPTPTRTEDSGRQGAPLLLLDPSKVTNWQNRVRLVLSVDLPFTAGCCPGRARAGHPDSLHKYSIGTKTVAAAAGVQAAWQSSSPSQSAGWGAMPSPVPAPAPSTGAGAPRLPELAPVPLEHTRGVAQAVAATAGRQAGRVARAAAPEGSHALRYPAAGAPHTALSVYPGAQSLHAAADAMYAPAASVHQYQVCVRGSTEPGS